MFMQVFYWQGIAQTYMQKPSEEDQKRRAYETEFFDGMRSKLSGNRQEAIHHFKRAIDMNPTQATAFYQLGMLYLQQKNLIDAKYYSLKAVQIEPKNEWYLALNAEILKADRQFKTAADAYENLFKLSSKVNYLFEACIMHTLSGKNKKAIRVLNKAEKFSGFSEDICRQREQIYLSENNLNKAIDEVKKMISHAPNEPRYQGMLADLYIATKREKEAIEIYKKLIQADASNGYAQFALADYYRSKGDREKYFSHLCLGMASIKVELKDKLMALNYMFMDTASISPFYPKAFTISDILIQTHSSEASVFSVRADIYLQQKNYDSARYYYSKALMNDGNSLAGWQQVLVCDQELRNNRFMKEDCEKAIQFFPNEALFYLYASFASAQLKEYSDAVSFSQRGIEFVNGNEKLLSELLSSLGDASHYAGMIERSDSAYEAALAIDENNTYALNNYAYYLSLRQSELDKAERMSYKSLQLDSGNASYYDTYGWILFQKKNYTKAKEYIEQSLNLSPNNAEVMEHLGDVNFQMGNKKEALNNWRKAIELGSPNELLPKKIKEEKINP